ncbi:hypothetical protein [Gordonia sp. (in: high G+C Gram-positive bacteria)]|uniref:hypothetical protein n=1 Tax=Gordonia sp. (in: high G+C Gram-positive bacteria) TaxID=84139 RepID=UPI0039E31D25
MSAHVTAHLDERHYRRLVPVGCTIDEALDEVYSDRAEAYASQHICLESDFDAELAQCRRGVAIVAQSCRTGLRIMLTAPSQEYSRSPAHMQAKSTEVTEIGAACPERGQFFSQHPVWRYHSLGIGTRLYLRAMARLEEITGTDMRCKCSAMTSYSKALRWKLHCEDPYTWESRTCPACADLVWEEAGRDDFKHITHDRSSVTSFV